MSTTVKLARCIAVPAAWANDGVTGGVVTYEKLRCPWLSHTHVGLHGDRRLAEGCTRLTGDFHGIRKFYVCKRAVSTALLGHALV
jgi:hypothetical protein